MIENEEKYMEPGRESSRSQLAVHSCGMPLASGGAVAAKNYQDLLAWKRAMDLVETVSRETAAAHGPVRELETHTMTAGKLPTACGVS